MRVLVTAGPTREPLDPVRYMSNRSSGRMGYALARALLRAGHEVVLVSGPVALAPPRGATFVAVETARQMLQACRRHWPRCQALIAAAAVADYRPAAAARRKLKREAGKGRVLKLVPNPDVLAALARRKGRRLAIGFALESGDGRAEARRKLRAKNLDWIVLNGPAAQGAKTARVLLLGKDGTERSLGPASKERLAAALVRLCFAPTTTSRSRPRAKRHKK